MLTVIVGPMFAGKTTELIRRMRCAEIAGQLTLVLKPRIDTRSGLEILSHSGLRLAAHVVDVRMDFEPPKDLDVLGVDEAQFLDDSWVYRIEATLERGVEVVAACLNQDSNGEPFGIAPQLLARADQIVHLKAVCVDCKRIDSATRTWRTSSSTDQVEIGGSDKYQALCRRCWTKRRLTFEAEIPNWDDPCQSPKRQGRHEVYINGDKTYCKSCGAVKSPMAEATT